jgi:hypothetical protein
MNASDTRELNDIRLEVGGVGKVVTVETSTAQVDLVNSGERSAVLSSKELNSLALVSRNVSELLKVLPGATSVATAPGSGNALGFDFTNSGSTGSAIGVGLSTNGAPYRGGSMLLMDGANIIDPRCNCWSTAVMNPEMTQEVKESTSNFAADQPNGPVVFSGTSKSGREHYHGSAYLTLRNSILNSNTWQNSHNNLKRQDAAWYYPGGNFGGPVPFTKNKLLFWTGYEYHWQKLPSQNPLTAWVPTDSMRTGNFSPTATDNAAVCAGVGGFSPTATNFCNDLSSTVLPNGSCVQRHQPSPHRHRPQHDESDEGVLPRAERESDERLQLVSAHQLAAERIRLSRPRGLPHQRQHEAVRVVPVRQQPLLPAGAYLVESGQLGAVPGRRDHQPHGQEDAVGELPARLQSHVHK